MHGPVVFQALMPINPDQLKEVYSKKVVDGKSITPQHSLRKGTRFLGYYKNGYAHGTFWIGMIGGNPYAHLHGFISNLNGTISGNNFSYIYPDMESAFVGKFENRVMKEAKHAKVVQLNCDKNGIPFVSKFSDESSDAIFYYESPSNISFGAGPDKVPDPYENKMVDLGISKIPDSGQGVFLKRDAKKNMVVSLYNGYVYDTEQIEIYKKHCSMNISKTDDERRLCSKYGIGIRMLDKMIYIPPELDIPETFFPTLGQKINHNFEYNNTHSKLLIIRDGESFRVLLLIEI